MLFAAVAFIQDKKYFGTAPEDELERIQIHEERFSGMHILVFRQLPADKVEFL